MLLDVLWALSPLLLIFIAIAFCNLAPDKAGFLAWFFCIGVACLYFETDLSVALLSSLSGFLSSLPISLVVGVAILQVTVMLETGALDRIVVLAKTMAVHERATQMLLLTCGFAIILTTLGAVPITVLPPVLLALGYSVPHAIGLAVMGYSAACPVSLLGIPGQILAAFCGSSAEETWFVLAWYMPLTNFAVAAGCLWFAGGRAMLREGIIPAVIVGFGCWAGTYSSALLRVTPVGGVIAGVVIVLLLCLFLRLKRTPIIDRSLLTEKDKAAERHLPLLAAISPWLLLTVICILINAPWLPLHAILFVDHPMTVHIIPGQPVHMRIFSQPYLWLMVSTVACVPFLKPRPGLLRDCVGKWLRRMIRPVLALSIYFVIAYVFNHSGKNGQWELTNVNNNMIALLAASAAQSLGVLYGAAAPFLGIGAGVISGSQAATIAMLSTLHMQTAAILGVNGPFVAAAGAMGGGISGMLSPAKLMTAGSTIDSRGQEGAILRSILGLCGVITLTVSLVCVAAIFL